MDNKVTQTLALGYVAMRMNFRGLCGSSVTYDEGKRETDDMALLLSHMQARFPGLPLALSGFSLDTFVQTQLQQRLEARRTPAERLALVGTAVGNWPMPPVTANTILIHGEVDDTIPLQGVFE